MISIVDATELQYVLRPTVYRAPSEPVDRSMTARRARDGAAADNGSFAAQSVGVNHAEVIGR